MFLSLILMTALMAGASDIPPAPLIRSIVIEGNSRISAQAILRHISAKPGSPFKPAVLQKDLKRLHELGIFEDLQVESRETETGRVDVIYRVREFPFIASFEISGVDSGLDEQIHDYLKKERLELAPAAPFNPGTANKAALAVRTFLNSRKYPNADVKVSIGRTENSVRVWFSVDLGRKLEIGTVRFHGNNSVPSGQLLKQMRLARPAHFWARWGGAARYLPAELQSDLQRLEIYYKSRGFAAVSIGTPKVIVTGTSGKLQIEIEIPIAEGDRYRLTSVTMVGHVKIGMADVERLVAAVPAPGDYDYSLLDSTRQKIIGTLGHYGYALAAVELKQIPNETDRTIQAVFKVNAGDPFAIGKIQFRGNNRLPDKFLRRELRAREGEVFDSAKLDRSVERLNKSNLVQELRRSDIALNLNENTSLLDITFNVKEKDRQGIYFTGGTGGISGGYLGLLYAAFNFLHLGETLSLELDGGAAQSNMLLNIVGTHLLGSPFTLALSVFNRYAGFNVANVVPGSESLVGVLKRRSRGIGLSGAYPVTGNLSVGMGFEAERDSVSDIAANTPPAKSLRSELAPLILFDNTTGTGPGTRGYRLSCSQGWTGSLFLKSLDSTRRSIQLTSYVSDPFTKGRNSFAFNLQGVWVRPHGGSPLLLERRFYPGDESVRGFSRGSLSPWAAAPGNPNPRAAGADTVLGFSTEYRVPIRGAVSGLGFFDIGWTHLDPKDASQLGSGALLIDATNGVLRASLGGELRVQLPVIRQPARVVFSWNPLRLNTVFRSPSSILQLAEPGKSIRFALGSLY